MIIHKGKILEVGSLNQLQAKTGLKELDDIFVKVIGDSRER